MKKTLLVLLIFLISFNTQSQTWEQIQEPTLRYLKEIAGMRGVLHMCKNDDSALNASDLIDETINKIKDQKIISTEVSNELLRLNNEETKRTIKEITDKEGDTFYLFNTEYCNEVAKRLNKYIQERNKVKLNTNSIQSLENFKVFDIPFYEPFDNDNYFIDERDASDDGEILFYELRQPNKYFSNQRAVVRQKNNSIININSHITTGGSETHEDRVKEFLKSKSIFLQILNDLKIKYYNSPLREIDNNFPVGKIEIKTYPTSNEKIYQKLDDLITDLKNYIPEDGDTIYVNVQINLKTNSKHLTISLSMKDFLLYAHLNDISLAYFRWWQGPLKIEGDTL